MNLVTRFQSPLPAQNRGPAARRAAGHTLIEAMFATGLFGLMLIGVMAVYFSGIEFNQYIQPKILNSQYSRQTVARLIEEVRSANSLQVGTGGLTNFTQAGATNLQTGNALRIYMATNWTGPYILYFHDQATATVQRVPASSTTPAIIAAGVTNHVIFSFEDYAGNVLTNSQNNAVMSVLLQLKRTSSWKNITDAYQVRARATRRSIL